MPTIINTVIISSAIIFGATGVSNAKDLTAEHRVQTNWSSNLTVEQNFENAVKSVTDYCKAESRKIDRREMAFRNRFESNCKSELMEDYVAKTGSVEIEELYTELKRTSKL